MVGEAGAQKGDERNGCKFFGGKVGEGETTRKTEAQMSRWAKNGS